MGILGDGTYHKILDMICLCMCLDISTRNIYLLFMFEKSCEIRFLNYLSLICTLYLKIIRSPRWANPTRNCRIFLFPL